MEEFEAVNILSTPKDELKQPPVNDVEGQESLVPQGANPKTTEAKQETLDSDTDAEILKFKVKVDGEEIEVDETELKKGYSRESHYQKKAKDLAKDREALTARESEIDAMISDAEILINDKRKLLTSEYMKELRHDDPDAYLRKVEEIESEIQKFDSLKAKRAAELKSKEDKLLAKERELLFESFPHWKNDEAVMIKESSQMFKALQGIGYTESEVNSISDHRMFILANKILKLEAIEGASLEAKEVKTKPKAVDPSGKSKESPSSAKKSAFDRLRKTGKIADAVNYLNIN